ncbi:MAG: hypothetical protein H6Q03_2204 [Acidobacteria bacterium]|nr:hypothetical protein [Acidobacteriota bacterium]
MRRTSIVPMSALLLVLSLALQAGALPAAEPTAPDLAASIARLEAELVARHGEAVRARLARGLAQASSLWRAEDGDAAAFEELARTHFAADPATRDAMFARLEAALQQTGGHLVEIVRALRMHVDLDAGAILPFDEILAGYAPDAHLSDDLFANRLAFVVLLNFPLTTLDERLAAGEGWTRREWAEARLTRPFSRRVPAAATQALTAAASAADNYIAQYNLWMHHVLDEEGRRLFPAGLRLVTHWNLRDEIKAAYADAQGLARQRLIAAAMERIVTQTIPAAVIDNPGVDWRPLSNRVAASPVDDSGGRGRAAAPRSAPGTAPEPDTRYAKLLDVYRAARLADPWSPTAPTLIARSFDEGRELPEPRVRAMFEQVLASPLLPRVAALVRARLGRPLEPFDVWYNGFRPRSEHGQAELDAAVAARYPSARAFAEDLPRILGALGFAPESARRLAAMVEVHPSRGIGHAFGAGLPGLPAYLRTRVEPGGMNYKGYNIAVHELGHNIEQTISLNDVDFALLAGVPNTAFTEALAFTFQARDLELLGLAKPTEESRALETLDAFWGTAEIAAVALVDMEVWHWMYEHPSATPAELREATVAIARRVWNRTWGPVLGVKDSPLLGIYSHMISNVLYLPDYPIGHFIAFQIQEQVERAGALGPEFERMARLGNIAPDLWMKQATGAPVGPEALLAATERALAKLE